MAPYLQRIQKYRLNSSVIFARVDNKQEKIEGQLQELLKLKETAYPFALWLISSFVAFHVLVLCQNFADKHILRQGGCSENVIYK
jgi:hypothetical protein